MMCLCRPKMIVFLHLHVAVGKSQRLKAKLSCAWEFCELVHQPREIGEIKMHVNFYALHYEAWKCLQERGKMTFKVFEVILLDIVKMKINLKQLKSSFQASWV